MVIKGVGVVATSAAGVARTGAGRAGFAVPAGGTAPLAAAQAVAVLDGLLLLQEVDDPPARDRRARKHGAAMLDALRHLQLELLGGDGSDAVTALAALAERCPAAADPGLRELLGAIALRAQVELARHKV